MCTKSKQIGAAQRFNFDIGERCKTRYCIQGNNFKQIKN